MKTRSIKLISLLLSFILLISSMTIFPVTVFAANVDDYPVGVTSGTTGDCTWTIDGTKLTISGDGYMADYQSTPPWGGAGITEVDIKYGVLNIGNNAFYRNGRKISTITIPASVKTIGKFSFMYCDGLYSVSIPDSVIAIGESAFCACSNLTSLFVGSGVSLIGNYAFSESPLESITVSPDNPNFDSRYNCNAIVETRTNTLVLGCSETVIPDTLTAIGDKAFICCDGLENITIPNGVKTIGVGAFVYCKNLKSVVLGESVETICVDAFAECSNLKSVTLSKQLSMIKAKAFDECDLLSDVYYPGTQTQWEAIEIENKNDSLLNATLHLIQSLKCEELGQQHVWNKISHTPPSCTAYGKDEYVCTKCSATKAESLSTTGHTEGKWETVNEPSETKEGLRVKKCTACGEILKSEAIPKVTPSVLGVFSVESTSGKTGDTVDVCLNIENNPSITSLQLNVCYSSDDLELLEVVDNSLFDSPITLSKNLSDNPLKISWFSSKSADCNNNGTLATLRFRIKQGAKSSPLTLSFDPENIFNSKFENKSFTVTNGTVIVEDHESENNAKFVVNSSVNNKDNTVDVKINIENNPSITSLQWIIEYSDTELELLEIVDNGLLDSPLSYSKNLSDDPFIISWFSSKSADCNKNGTVATLKFKLKEGAKYSGIKLSYNEDNIFNSSFDNTYFKTVYEITTTSTSTSGDVNSDGKVDITDATYVQMYVAEIIRLNHEQQLSADTNGDGKTDITDATYIQMYVAEIIDHLGK